MPLASRVEVSASPQTPRRLVARAHSVDRVDRFQPDHGSDRSPPGRQLLALQRSAGNRAVNALLRSTAPRVQRCGATPPDRCPCHAGDRTDDHADHADRAEEDGRAVAGSPRVARQATAAATGTATGEGHDLGSGLLHGDPVLEEVKEGERVLKVGSSGPAVGRIQQALASVGHPTGDTADAYGPRTAAAVRRFQAASGMGFMEQDGRVGKRTITVLDNAVRVGTAAPDPDAESEDDVIADKYTRSADEPDRVFFTLGSAELDAEERGKLDRFAGEHQDQEVWMTGLASEEGPESLNAALAQQRIDVVAGALSDAGHASDRHPRPTPKQAEGSSRYRFMRAVQLATSEPVTAESCEGRPGSEPCRPDVAVKINAANTRAAEILVAALDAFTDPDRSGEVATRADELLRELYNTTDADHAQTRRAVALQALEVLDVIRDPSKFVCGTECDPVCLGGASAVHGGGEITVCANGLDEEDDATRPALMIHEAHHAGVDGSEDLAYNYSRLLRHLTPDQALQNANSFHGIVVNTVRPDGMPLTARLPRITPITNDDYQVPDPDTNGPRIEHVLGWLAEWVGTTDFTTASVYKGASEARRSGRYPTPGAPFAMSFLAPRFDFDVRPPPGCFAHLPSCPAPTDSDLQMVAAINDRVDLMEAALDGDLTVRHRPGQPTTWTRGSGTPGDTIDVSDHFVAADDNVRASILMDALVAATPGISARYAVEYTAWINFVREARDRLGPESPRP